MVALKSLELGGTEVRPGLREDPHTMIVDSGTTLLLLQRDLWNGTREQQHTLTFYATLSCHELIQIQTQTRTQEW